MKITGVQAKGATLLECLIALVIFSVVLLGLIGAMLQCLRIERGTYHRLLALSWMSRYDEKLRLQHSSCRSAEQFAIQNISTDVDLSNQLPHGILKLTFENTKAKILISWQEGDQMHQLVSSIPLSY